MKASQLIKKIRDHVKEHGDLPVHFDGMITDMTVGAVVVCDDKGNPPDENNTQPYEIFLHQGSRVALKSKKMDE